MRPLFYTLLALHLNFSAYSQKTEIGNLVVEGVPKADAAIEEQLAKYQNVRAATLASWDQSGKGIFVSTRFADVNQIHHVATPGGDRQQITFFKEPLTTIDICTDKSKNGFIYRLDKGGNENYQIYFHDLGNKTNKLLSDGTSRNDEVLWNNKGTKIAYVSNLRNGADMELYIKNMTDLSSNFYLEFKGGGLMVEDWSEDDSKLLLSNYKSISESEVFIFDLNTKKLEPVFNNIKKVFYSNARFSKNKNGIFYISEQDSEFNTLRFLDLNTKKEIKLSSKINWDVENFEISKDGKIIIFHVNEGGYSQLYTLNTQTFSLNKIDFIQKGVINNFVLNDNGIELAFDLTRPNLPSDVYVANLISKKLVKWTNSELFGLDTETFTDASLVNYETFDNRKIPAFQYKPSKKSSEKTPVFISIHGGPEGQSMPLFNAFNQYLCNELGITVITPNVRGSTGYGKTYLSLDNAELRENSVKDIGALLDWIKTQPDLDADKIIVYGGSYGGYMCLASMTKYNDKIKAGIDLFGISNFTTFLKNTSPYRADLRRAEYGDERKPEMAAVFEKISPIKNIKNITKPMLIYQGKNDPRVPLSESEQMVDSLKKQGNKIWYVMANDEGHSLAKKANRDYMYMAMIMFIKENIR